MAVCAGGAFAGTFLVYLLTLCPTVYVEGSGELIGAVHFLGTSHPTGYPLFCLVGRLFSAFLPWGSVAFKVNAATACTGALAAGCLAAFLHGRGCRAWVCAGAGMALGFSRTFWSQSVVAEVYGLSTLMALLVLAVGLQAIERREPRLLVLTGFLMGLGLTTHLNQVLVWPGLLLLLLWRWPGLWRRGRLLAGTGLAAIGGYSLVLYLPLRNGRGPGFHWGDLGTPGLLWEHLTGALYRSSFFSIPWEGVLLNAGRWVGQMTGEFHPLLAPVCVWGVWQAWQRDRLALVGAGGMVLMNLIAVFNYHRDPNGIGVFFLPSLAGMALFLGYGLDHLGRFLGQRGAVLAGVLAPMAVMAANWTAADRSGNDIAYQYGKDILDDLPREAVLITEADDASYILDYLQRVEGERPDVTLFNRVGRGTDLLSGEERRQTAKEQARTQLLRERALIQKGERPVFFLVARVMPADGYQFLPAGLVYRVAPAGEKPQECPIDLSNAQKTEIYRDPWVRKIQANYWFMVGEQQLALGRQAEAVRAYERAAEVAFDSRTMRYNIAVVLYRCGELERARVHALAAREIDPWQPGPYRLLARLARLQGRLGEEKYLLKRAANLEGYP